MYFYAFFFHIKLLLQLAEYVKIGKRVITYGRKRHMKNKDSKARMQVIFGVLLFAFVMLAELYAMINFPDMYLGIVGLALIDIVCLYTVINGVFTIREVESSRNEEQYDSVFKSEKASYLMQRKYFEEIEDRLNYLEKASKIPTEEIVNAQKGIAKVIINRNRENTEALIGSNDQVMEQFEQLSNSIADITKLLTAYKDEVVTEQKNSEGAFEQNVQVKVQDLMLQIKDMELRLNQEIGKIQTVSIQQPVTPLASAYIPQPEINAKVEAVEEQLTEAESSILDESQDMVDMPTEEPAQEVDSELDVDSLSDSELNVDDVADIEDVSNIEDVSDLDDLNIDIPDDLEIDGTDLENVDDVIADLDIPMEEDLIPETVEEEEKPAMPDLSDPNKKMSPDEIAALFANMSGDDSKKEEEPEVVEQPAEEPESVEEKAEEEAKPEMPDLSDPNKTLSPDEIAALFSNMSDESPKEEKQEEVEAEPIEQKVEEEKPPMPDLSDPNKNLSPDEIAALFANMQ